MGDFLIKVASMGGHGCNRDAKAGETFQGCGRIDCPDCFAAEMVANFKRRFPVHYALFIHWPTELNATLGRSYDQAHEVVDDMHYVTKDGWSSPNLRKRINGEFGK